MQSLILLMTRLASQAARGELADARERAVRTIILAVAIAVLSIAAIGLLTAAAAVALANWIGLVPALLSMAAAVTILTLILMLVIRHHPRRRPSGLLGTLPSRTGEPHHVAPLTIVAIGLAAGLFLGLRGQR
jgi:hypothetical protein